MKLIFAVCLFLSGFAVSAQLPKAKATDFDVLAGSEFTGTMTLVNPDTEVKKIVPVKLIFTSDPKAKNSWNLSFEFPENPVDNETQTIKLISGGRYINDQEVTSRSVTETGLTKITAEEVKDDQTFVYRYLLGKDSFNLKVVEKTGPDTFIPLRAIDVKR